MGDVKKRWSVTYTKHVQQKRKVYQDGFLELHDSSHKIMLYDYCEKLLICRIAKNDDVVKSGETLEFNSYLVDIGDLEGDHMNIPNANLPERDKKITDEAGLVRGRKFKHNSVPVEFKKNEMNKYGAPRSCPDPTKPSYSEWIVLYTTQITQKAKKYHDGILRVATCGSQGRQVTLYDVSKRPLDSRFLKKGEVIGSGESLAFDGHLVDIQEPEGDHKPPVDLKVQGRNCTASGRTGLSDGQETHHSSIEIGRSASSDSVLPPPNCLKPVKTFMREWHALYTTQISQKAKKYHSGILRLASCNSYQMQVGYATLLNEDGTILSRKYLKSFEDVRNGSTFELPKYLVEVGEPRTCPEGEPPKSNCSGKGLDTNFSGFHVENFKLKRSVLIDKPLCDEFKKNEMNKYGAPRNCPDDTKSSSSEWIVLYTTQITQKAKKYHDGILRVATCGYQGRQVTLYDTGRRLLDSRFLKKDEVIGSGESLALDGHLVDIGEPEGDHRPPEELKVPGRNCTAGGKTGFTHGRQTQPSTSVEIENSGSSNSMSPLNGLKAIKTFTRGEPSKSASSEKDKDFSAIDVDNFKRERRVPIDNPLRDASGILSILKKTMTQEGSVPLMSTSVKECRALQSSEFIQFDPQHQVERHLVRDSNSENSEAHNHGEETCKRLKPDTLLPIQITKSADFENIGESQLKYTFTSSSSVRSRASDISSPTDSDPECTDKSILRPVSSVEKPQVLDAFKLNCPDSFQPPTASVPNDGTIGNFPKSISSNVSSSCHGNPFSEELNIRTSPPPEETRWHEGDCSGVITNSNGCKSHESSDSGRQNSKENKSACKMDEIPSFDLGF
ncbi:hypothetical protein RHGRI_019902 [Rhododendron griersonianum]|uniref:5'-3' DNA helicase ZGRF1-like N-terminal domain-containing protein n=1 Tax=Rhododendron griersonianum TaxID=479676 RepID=A0AAV6JIB5_9ERIC|nr:hypothetical protein RHGRI_019902 [Rhododendron griersonianum]